MIRMSKLTDYAIVLLAHLARSSGTLTAHELAERSRVPLPTVSKLAKELSKAGLVVSHRGRNGGYGLSRPAERISVAEIVEALEGPIALTECAKPGRGDCGIEDTCLARSSWDPVSRAVETALRNLPLSAIAPFRTGEPSPVQLGSNTVTPGADESPTVQIGSNGVTHGGEEPAAAPAGMGVQAS